MFEIRQKYEKINEDQEKRIELLNKTNKNQLNEIKDAREMKSQTMDLLNNVSIEKKQLEVQLRLTIDEVSNKSEEFESAKSELEMQNRELKVNLKTFEFNKMKNLQHENEIESIKNFQYSMENFQLIFVKQVGKLLNDHFNQVLPKNEQSYGDSEHSVFLIVERIIDYS